MTTEDIAEVLEITSKLMDLHEENPFKVRAMAGAAYNLSKTRLDLNGKSKEEIEQLEGVGKGIAAKIFELQKTGTTSELEELRSKTPIGVIDMLGIKGLGPKKVRQLWKGLEVESVGELLYACNENRLVDLKGFGEKTQESVKQNIEFKLSNTGKAHYATIEKEALAMVAWLQNGNMFGNVSLTGEARRKCEVITEIEVLAATRSMGKVKDILIKKAGFKEHETIENAFVSGGDGFKKIIYLCEPENFAKELFITTGPNNFVKEFLGKDFDDPKSEEEIFEGLKLQYIEPELRDIEIIAQIAKENKIPALIEFTDLKGSLHNHSTYSDGMNTLEEMAVECKRLGYEYFGICDHSQTAVYAGGLKPETVLLQQKEIDKLNEKLAPFKIFKGIESDILGDGRLDYDESILKTFDFVVASVHSGLKMDEDKATKRLLKAIENPYTTILGHPTGRLLLGRPGYPIDHKKIIDACAANNVIVELNAHPYRLDIDWRWIPYCIEKGVKISINPDAHQKEGFGDMHFGTLAARKGMLTKESCFNAMTLKDVETFFNKRKSNFKL